LRGFVDQQAKAVASLEGIVFQSKRVPESQSAEQISLNRLGGIHAFIERCGRIESISDEMRALVETRWPELVHKLPPKH
jgi:hypothetical protein